MSRNTINEVFDTQQMLFAKRLATANLGDLLADESARSLPKTKKLVHHGKRGEQDDDALAFAIFDRQGKMLLNDGENGADFLFDGEREGFTDGERKGDDDSWRLVWLTSPDGRYRIVVGEWDYRRDMALGMVTGQLVPRLATLPVLMLLIALMVGRELRPLRAVAAGLRRRAPDDATPLDARQCRPRCARWWMRSMRCSPASTLCWCGSGVSPPMPHTSCAARWRRCGCRPKWCSWRGTMRRCASTRWTI